MNDKWNGEARGCADVMVTRIRNLMRQKGIGGKHIDNESAFVYNQNDFEKEFAKVIATLETNDLPLCDVLENIYLQLKDSK